MHELEALRAQRPAELPRVARETHELAAEQKPPTAAVRRCPDVREARHRARVHFSAGFAEQVGRRTGRAIDVWLESLPVELPDQIRQRLRRATQLGAMVDEEDPNRAAHALMLAVPPARLTIPP